MEKKIPHPGKKWAREKIGKMCHDFRLHIIDADRAELKAIILTAKQFSSTNCGWLEYWMKDIVVKIAEDMLMNVAPKPQQKKRRLTAQH